MAHDLFFKNEQFNLHKQAKMFVQKYPQLSQFLAENADDPDVERTLDGFAYLTGVLHAKTEEEYPQLIYALIDMFWPNYLQPTPSMTIAEFSAKTENPIFIQKKTKLKSKTNKNDLNCTFKTTRNIHVLPLDISSISISDHFDFKSLKVDFKLHEQCKLDINWFKNLCFYLGDNSTTSHQLYLWFNRYLSLTELIIDDNNYVQPNLSVKPLGFENSEATLTYPKNTYIGYRFLQEYLCFPESFLFVEFNHFSLPKNISEITHFSLQFHFNRSLPENLKLRKNSLKINCTPAINLFEFDLEPIILDGKKTRYPLIPSYSNPENYEIFSINKVNGWINAPNKTKKLRDYYAFESFKHQIEYDNGNLPFFYKIDRQHKKNTDEIDYFLSFIRGDETTSYIYDEVISVQAICTNKNEAAKLKIGDICYLNSDIAQKIEVKNITRPSITMRSKLDKSQHWTTISTLSLNYLSLLNKEGLTQILNNYNMAAIYSRQSEEMLQKIIENLESFSTKPIETFYQNLPIQGLQSTIYLNQSPFNNEGELYLFASVLANFYSHFATVNSFHSLIVINSTNQEKYEWPAKISQ